MPLLRCIDCQTEFSPSTPIYLCSACEGLLDLVYDAREFEGDLLKSIWDSRRASAGAIDQSGVWRFRELLPEASAAEIITMVEGNTQIWDAPRSAHYAGMDRLSFKHLGMNPTGSFKDLGMTTGVTQARRLGSKIVACASTGNTSASMAAYAARAGLKAFVFVPSGQVSLGKLAQALDYGAIVIQIEGGFDEAMQLVREVAKQVSLYLLNSVNPFRLEGQKTIAYELLQQRGWRVPDRIIVPGGNLGNSSAIAKGFYEMFSFGVIERMPKLTIVQAEGANPLFRMWHARAEKLTPIQSPITLATAIKIGSPVSWPKAIRGLKWSGGDVESVNEDEIADAKAIIGRDGIGCEPASAVTLAGLKRMVEAGSIDSNEDVVAILTGHFLKDPDYSINYHRGSLATIDQNAIGNAIKGRYANSLKQAPTDLEAILRLMNNE
jgi:threonine synthase